MRLLTGYSENMLKAKLMKIIKGYSEDEVLRIIMSISKRLASKFVFGIHDKDDIKQEATIIGIKALDKYKEQAPIEAYLYTVIKSKLQTFKRDNSVRYGVSCSYCVRFDPTCDSCLSRQANEQGKYNLLYPLDISKVRSDGEKSLQSNDDIEDVDEKELFKKIDVELPADMRQDYLRIRDGLYVSKKRRTEIELKIFTILGEIYDN